MTKYDKVKKIFTEFALNHNDARVSVMVKEYPRVCNQISIKIECKFDEYLGTVSYRMLFTSDKKRPSIGLLQAMKGIDYTIKDLYTKELSITALESLINSVLDAAIYEIETKLKTERLQKAVI